MTKWSSRRKRLMIAAQLLLVGAVFVAITADGAADRREFGLMVGLLLAAALMVGLSCGILHGLWQDRL